ncbi:hypothetical protein [Streptomyces nigrescens]|uniref:hypothetical protein n=1 Tax=Streptomyces nigrescens TaxID=1920 RepID=UPI00348AD22F
MTTIACHIATKKTKNRSTFLEFCHYLRSLHPQDAPHGCCRALRSPTTSSSAPDCWWCRYAG